MPLIKIRASVAAPSSDDVKTLLQGLSSKLSKHLGKPESYVMTSFEPEVEMTFAGTFDPVCYIEIKNIGRMAPELTKTMSQDFCQEIETHLGVPQNRIYIEFADVDRSLWGWNGKTFA